MYQFTIEPLHLGFGLCLWFRIGTKILADRRIWRKKDTDRRICIPLFTPLFLPWTEMSKNKLLWLWLWRMWCEAIVTHKTQFVNNCIVLYGRWVPWISWSWPTGPRVNSGDEEGRGTERLLNPWWNMPAQWRTLSLHYHIRARHCDQYSRICDLTLLICD